MAITLQSFNKFGSRLVHANRNVDVSNIKKFNGAQFADFVTVQSQFGKKTDYIVSLKDEYGKLIERRRTTFNKDTGKVERMHGFYENIPEDGFFHVERKYSRKNKVFKKENIQESFGYILKKDAKEIFSGSKKFTHLVKNLDNRKYVEFSHSRSNKWELLDSDIKDNCLPQEAKEKLSALSYLHDMYLSGKEFVKAIFNKSVQASDLKLMKPQLKLRKLTRQNDLGLTVGNVVTLDTNKIYSNSELVNILNHELRHVKQNEVLGVQELENIYKEIYGEEEGEKIFEQKIKHHITLEERMYAMMCEIGSDSYKKDSKSMKNYQKNFLEVDANKTGHKARDEYFEQIGIKRHILNKYMDID